MRIERVAGAWAPFVLPHPVPALVAEALLCDVHTLELRVLADAVEDGITDVVDRTEADLLAGQASVEHFHGHLTVAAQNLVPAP